MKDASFTKVASLEFNNNQKKIILIKIYLHTTIRKQIIFMIFLIIKYAI